MSKTSEAKITCPKCGKESSFTVWESVNRMLDPDAAEAVIDGSLFDFQCPNCGYKTRFYYPMLYHDMENGVMVFFVEKGNLEEGVKHITQFKEMPMPGKHLLKSVRYRVVDDINDLREKAVIFKSQLDDRVIEIMKLFYFSIYKPRETKGHEIVKAFFADIDGRKVIQFYSKNAYEGETEFNMNIYGKLEAALNQGEPTPEDSKDYIVNLEWAMDHATIEDPKKKKKC